MLRSLARLVLVFGLMVTAQSALAEKRLALVIGNGSYEHSPLANPPRDADLIAKTLLSVGFEVTKHVDLNRRSMRRAFFDFGQRVEEAGEETVALIYYAGHGVQVDGENYLIPVNSQIEDAFDVEIEAIRASSLLKTFGNSSTSLNIVILDACRNNPFKGSTRAAHRGLAKMDAPTGTLLAYSTAPGTVALDGSGSNSPYTRALAAAIKQPGLTVEQAFKSVRISVMDRTQNQQVPWESSSLVGNFSFAGGSAPQVASLPAEPVEPAQPTITRSDGGLNQVLEIEFWKSIAESNNPALFQSYLDKFPDGVFSEIARQRVQTASAEKPTSVGESDLVFFQSIQNSEKAEDFEAYLNQFPTGKFAPIAKARIKTIRQKQANQQALAQQAAEKATWDTVKDSNNIGLLQAFLDVYPNGIYAKTARAKVASINESTQVASTTPQLDEEKMLWNTVKDTNSAAELKVYLAAYPNGRFATEARTKIASLTTPAVQQTVPAGYDGAWKLTARHVRGPFGRIPFCRNGETLETIVMVKNGYFETKANSSKSAPVTISGQINRAGKLDLEFKPWGASDSGGWGNTIERGDLRLRGSLEGRNSLTKMTGEDCKVELTLRRAN